MCRFLLVAAVVSTALVVGSCDPGGEDAATPSSPATPASVSTSGSPTPVEPPSPPASPPPTRGRPDATCVNGWVTPAKRSPKYASPLGVIRRTTGARGPLVITDLRYFTGPESPPSDKGYILVVERWYVRLYARRDPAFQGRFLVEARRFGQGLAAVAPYDTHGFRSPDWTGFQLDSGGGGTAYPGLPGTWPGTPYDFVKGGEGLTIPGLPSEVAGCLNGT